VASPKESGITIRIVRDESNERIAREVVKEYSAGLRWLPFHASVKRTITERYETQRGLHKGRRVTERHICDEHARTRTGF
jgi:hypothetical protein